MCLCNKADIQLLSKVNVFIINDAQHIIISLLGRNGKVKLLVSPRDKFLLPRVCTEEGMMTRYCCYKKRTTCFIGRRAFVLLLNPILCRSFIPLLGMKGKVKLFVCPMDNSFSYLEYAHEVGQEIVVRTSLCYKKSNQITEITWLFIYLKTQITKQPVLENSLGSK